MGFVYTCAYMLIGVRNCRNATVLKKWISGSEGLTQPCNSPLTSCSVVAQGELLSQIREFPEKGLMDADPRVKSVC